jgi:hypothetical protein
MLRPYPNPSCQEPVVSPVEPCLRGEQIKLNVTHYPHKSLKNPEKPRCPRAYWLVFPAACCFLFFVAVPSEALRWM